MTPRLYVAAAVAALVFGGGFASGRGCAPSRVVEHSDSEEVIRRLRDEVEHLRVATRTEVKRAPVVRETFDVKTGAVTSRTTSGPVTVARSTESDASRAAHAEEHAASHVVADRSVAPAASPAPRLTLHAGAAWGTADLALRPVVSLGADLRILDRLHLDVSYAPPALNASPRHDFRAELRLNVLEW